jgi:hypothetical protein
MLTNAENYGTLQEVQVRVTNDHLQVWKGRDFWHKDTEVNIKLLDSKEIQLYTRKHGGVLKRRQVTLEQLHAAIEALIEETNVNENI